MTKQITQYLPELADRFRFRREQLGLTQEQVADKIVKRLPRGSRFNRVTVSNIELDFQKSLKDKVFVIACDILKCRSEWLAFGTGPIEEVSNSSDAKLVPELELADVVNIASNINELNKHRKINICPIECSPNTFSMRVAGDSMLTRFEQGDLIFVDTALADPENKKFVVAVNKQEKIATFKQLNIEDGVKLLKSLNPDFPPELRYTKMNDTWEIIGTVVAHLKPI